VGSVRVTCRSVTDDEMEITPAAALGVFRSGDIAPLAGLPLAAQPDPLLGAVLVVHDRRSRSLREPPRLLLADFGPQVGWILSQPFLIEATVSGQTRRQVPDFALIDRRASSPS